MLKRSWVLGIIGLSIVFGLIFQSCKTTRFISQRPVIRQPVDLPDNPDDVGEVVENTVNTEQDVPSNAVTKGSFTVWTEPEDPAPLQAYWVVIQVNLDKSLISNYRKSDLEGYLVGTDKYTQHIGYKNIWDYLKKFPEKGYVRLYSRVPGALENVQDDIEIKSKSLNETQKISIVF